MWDEIGALLDKVMDTDSMDIWRKGGRGVNADGSTHESCYEPLHANVPCHLVVSAGQDTPTPTEIDGEPVRLSVAVHCALKVDVQNGDRLVVRRNATVYEGTAGLPAVSAGRQKVLVAVESG